MCKKKEAEYKIGMCAVFSLNNGSEFNNKLEAILKRIEGDFFVWNIVRGSRLV